jgi:hypothetical protein
MRRSGDIAALMGFAGPGHAPDRVIKRNFTPCTAPCHAPSESGRAMLADLAQAIDFYLDPAGYDRATLAFARSLQDFIAPSGEATTREDITNRLALIASVCDDILCGDGSRH